MVLKVVDKCLCIGGAVIDEIISTPPNRDSIAGAEVVVLIPVIDLFSDVFNHEELHSVSSRSPTKRPIVSS